LLPQVSKIEALKAIIRAWGMNPEQILAREAFNQPARTYITQDQRQSNELKTLSSTLRDLILKEANTQKVQIRAVDGGPDGN
jgi:hypothetical protein